ncbi:LOG family protein [Listeria booriae]|uniref:LOG family protein n=1 Tax=Listeria booriae TaxID=1552123 RepID=UPI00162410CF|nr:TIGR00730 family Rossman fold protein [Listeria booriae]MBC2324835.1 TIGR00730 family Rossman fold protein [Listeria booriae]MCD2208481.1 TIGR00730 family Rossman fold protein [Listeria booriae]
MNIVVYCGANKGNNPVYERATIAVGEWIARNNNTLVYGGGRSGLMGILADTVIASGGKAIGIIPTFLKERELAHPHLTELIIVDTMDERKQKMLNLGNACIALPGGPGTLEEITEVVSWSRLGQNNNPCIFYNENDYYRPIQQFYDDMVQNDFLTVEDRSKILFSNSVDEIHSFITDYVPPVIRTY